MVVETRRLTAKGNEEEEEEIKNSFTVNVHFIYSDKALSEA
jgi:hypothetical protein